MRSLDSRICARGFALYASNILEDEFTLSLRFPSQPLAILCWIAASTDTLTAVSKRFNRAGLRDPTLSRPTGKDHSAEVSGLCENAYHKLVIEIFRDCDLIAQSLSPASLQDQVAGKGLPRSGLQRPEFDRRVRWVA